MNGKGSAGLVSKDDSVIFIENGVYSANTSIGASAYFVLKSDARARAMETPQGIKEIDYDGFVELCTRCDKVVTW